MPTKVCKTCRCEKPATSEYFYKTGTGIGSGLRGSCRACRDRVVNEWRAEKTRVAAAVRETKVATFVPRVIGSAGSEGGYSTADVDGYRIVYLPDSHGHMIDWKAAEAALAFVRYYRPVRIIMLGDHVDLCAVSRFRKSPEQRFSVGQDLEEARKFVSKVRESAGPDCRIAYLKGNHEARLQHYIWEHADALDGLKGLSVPAQLGLADWNVEWVESGTVEINARLIAKHGHLVRARSGYTGTGELERNGVSGVSGHTHRLGQVYKRNRTGVHTWVESGCLCTLDPDYLEGQVADWQHGLAFGSVSLAGHGFTLHTAPIIKGRVYAHDRVIGP